MRSVTVAGFMIVLVVALTAASERARAQSAMDDLKTMLGQAASTAEAIKKDNADLQTVYDQSAPVRAWKQRHEEHRCFFPDGHPEVCAAYDKEASDINAAMAPFKTKLQRISSSLKEHQQQFRQQTHQIRIQANVVRALSGLQSWIDGYMEPCFVLLNTPETEEATGEMRTWECMNRAWANRPR